ncbi:hypothetical protein ACOME3_010422 [Neoechinorhynchus agilis]
MQHEAPDNFRSVSRVDRGNNLSCDRCWSSGNTLLAPDASSFGTNVPIAGRDCIEGTVFNIPKPKPPNAQRPTSNPLRATSHHDVTSFRVTCLKALHVKEEIRFCRQSCRLIGG